MRNRLTRWGGRLVAIGLALSTLVTGHGAAEMAGPHHAYFPVVRAGAAPPKVREEIDFATSVLNDPWDMNNRDDILPNGLLNQPGKGFANVSFVSGVFSGQTVASDAYLWLLHQGYPDANNVDLHSGKTNPIDATRYNYLTFRLYRDDGDANVPVRVYWYRSGDEITGQPCGVSVALLPFAGWHIYVLNLADSGKWQPGACAWQGAITGLRLDPMATADTTFRNKQIQLDWARLVDPSSVQPFTISWNTGVTGLHLVSLYVDNNNNFGDGTLAALATNLSSATAGSYNWTFKGLPPGIYYVHAIVDGAREVPTNAAPLIINQTPLLAIVDPGMTSGADYATTVLGSPWSFNDGSAVERLDEIASATYGNGVMNTCTAAVHSGCPADCGDPQIWFNVPADPLKTIDAARFKYLTLRYWQEGVQDVGHGWVARLFWSPSPFPSNMTVGDDLIVRDGWPGYTASDGYYTYQFDLSNLLLEPGFPNPGWNNSLGRIAYLRFDPTEVAASQTLHLKQVYLTADPVAAGSYVLTWSLVNPDDTATVTAYYGAANSSTRVQIGSVRQPTNQIVWKTTGVPSGSYSIYLEANDGFNVTGRTSVVKVVVP